MFCFCEWCFYRFSVSKRENSCSNPIGLLGVWVMMPWSSLWEPFSPCPWGVVSILLHLFHGCLWIWAPCFYSALTQGTLGFIPLADRTNIKGDTEEHLKEGWEVEQGMTFPSKHMLGRWGREGLQPCWKEEMCVYFWCKCHVLERQLTASWEKNVLVCSPASSFLQLLWRGDKWAAELSPPWNQASCWRRDVPCHCGIWDTCRASAPMWLSCHSAIRISSAMEIGQSKLANIKIRLEHYQRDWGQEMVHAPKEPLGATFRIFGFAHKMRHLWESEPRHSMEDWGVGGAIGWAPWVWAERLLNELTSYENAREKMC